MIEQTVTVVEVAEEGVAWVEAERTSSCGSCQASKGCGTSVLGKLFNRTQRVRVLNPIGAEPTETVVIGIEERALLSGSVIVYLLPLLTMLGMAVLGEAMAPAWQLEQAAWLTPLFALIGLAGGLYWVRRFSRQIQHNPRYQPVILRRISNGPIESPISIQHR